MAKDQYQDLEWIKLKDETLPAIANANQRTPSSKFVDKFKENPFIPIGCTATVAALVCGLYFMKTGNSRQSQMMMRARILAQGFTIVALIGGVVIGTQQMNRRS